MHAGFAMLKPCFTEQAAPSRGTFVIGTVRGDLHDIGKNLVSIILEGAGWQIVDLGVDCAPKRFVEAVQQHAGCAVGLSALLTTTMVNMQATIAAIRAVSPTTKVLVGGAPVTAKFAEEIGRRWLRGRSDGRHRRPRCGAACDPLRSSARGIRVNTAGLAQRGPTGIRAGFGSLPSTTGTPSSALWVTGRTPAARFRRT